MTGPDEASNEGSPERPADQEWAEDATDDVWLAPLPDTALEIESPAPDAGPVPPDMPDIGAGDLWEDEPSYALEPLMPSERAVLPGAVPLASDAWLIVGEAPPDFPEEHIGGSLASASGTSMGTQSGATSKSGRSARRRSPWVLAFVAVFGAAAVFFGLRYAGSDKGDQAGTAGPQATVTLPTALPTTLALTTVPTTLPLPSTTLSTTTSTTSTTVQPSTTTSAPTTTTTQPPRTTTSVPVAVTSQPGQVAYGPFCGFVPGSSIAVDVNGVPIGNRVAGPDGCVSGTVPVAR